MLEAERCAASGATKCRGPPIEIGTDVELHTVALSWLASDTLVLVNEDVVNEAALRVHLDPPVAKIRAEGRHNAAVCHDDERVNP